MKTNHSVLTAVLLAYSALAGAQASGEGAGQEVELPPGLRIDERVAERPMTVNVFGRPAQLRVSWDVSAERRGNFDLDAARARDRSVLEHEIKFDARLRASPTTSVFVQAVGLHDSRRTQGRAGTQVTRALERGQTWALMERLADTPWSMQIGRVALIERRAWWWDDDLDALRLMYGGGAWRLDTGLARELARVSSADDGVRAEARGLARWFGQLAWRWAPRHTLEAFWLYANDSSGAVAPGSVFADEDHIDPSDLDARWHGLRASGETRFESGQRFAYWADAAMLRGSERATGFTEGADGSFTAGATSQRRVRGQALDLGLKWTGPGPYRPALTLGLARGSGGERSASLDANFRQTGLQENKGRIAGVKRLRYYGELLQPELSNLAIATVSLGLRMLDHSSVELLWHRYRQLVASTQLPGSRLSTSPLGADRDIGSEIDLFVALREWRQFELTLTLSRFDPGRAFAADRRSRAHAIELGAALTF